MRFPVEIDGRRVMLGLPASFAGGFSAPGAAQAAPAAGPAADAEAVLAPVAGTLQSWRFADGDAVESGAVLVAMEAMKMETNVVAHRAGRLRILATDGYQDAGTPLARIETASN